MSSEGRTASSVEPYIQEIMSQNRSAASSCISTSAALASSKSVSLTHHCYQSPRPLTLNPPSHILAKKVEYVHKITLWTKSFLSPTRRTRSECVSLSKYLHVVSIITHTQLKLSCLLLVCFRIGHDAVLESSSIGARLCGAMEDGRGKRRYTGCRRRESCSECDVNASA